MHQMVCELTKANASTPRRSEDGSAGYDLVTPIRFTILSGEQLAIPIGIKMQFPPDRVALIFDRSSLGARGLSRHAGVIDSSYRGEWIICLRNHSEEDIRFKIGDRIAQVVFVPVFTEEIAVGMVNSTERGEGGFGSTGQ